MIAWATGRERTILRIAIYEPESFLGGMLTWAVHLQTGLRDLGHEADLITFTRSGRSKAAWSSGMGLKARPSPYDQVGRYSTAAELLSQYDGIIHNDPLSYLQDAAAQRGQGHLTPNLPDYLSVLRQATCPVTTTVHCGDYNARIFPFRDEFLDLPTLTGTVVTHSQATFNAGRDLWPDWTAIEVPLPYALREPLGSATLRFKDLIDPPAVGITGRYTAVKGHRAIAAAAAYGYLPSGVDVELWGSADVFAGPSATVKTYEQLVAIGWRGTRQPGSASVAVPWTVRDARHRIRYNGGYLDAWPALHELDVHVNLTTTVASGGAVEYSQLEAMDAGCAQVSPAHRWVEPYRGAVIPSVKRWPSDLRFSMEKLGTNPVLTAIGTGVQSLLDRSPSEVKADRDHNRETIARLHHPATVAQAFINALTA